MRLKSITAADIAKALAEVRASLGEDAVIVSRHDVPGGGVRVTAAVDDDDLDLADLLQPAGAPAEIAWLRPVAQHHQIEDLIERRLADALIDMQDADPGAALAQALGTTFRFEPLPPAASGPLLLVGPPGAGKTASVAKLAARAVLAGDPVRVVSADVERSGGIEQLVALVSPLGLDVAEAGDGAALRRHAVSDGRLVIVDTPGFNPFRPADIGRLSSLLDAVPGPAALVLPAGLIPADCVDIAETVRALGISLLLPTKLDTARRLGGVLSAAAAGLSITEAGIGPTVGRGLGRLTATGLARLLLHARPAPKALPQSTGGKRRA